MILTRKKKSSSNIFKNSDKFLPRKGKENEAIKTYLIFKKLKFSIILYNKLKYSFYSFFQLTRNSKTNK